MVYLILIALLIVLGSALVFVARNRRSTQAKLQSSLVPENLALLRQIDKLVLGNVSLPYLTDKVVNMLPETGQFLGGSIRATGERGILTILAVTKKLHGTEHHPGLGRLTGVALTAEVLQRSRSLIVQAINERRVVIEKNLSDFECPPLTSKEAAAIQQAQGIRSIAAYPIVTEEVLAGTMTFYFDRPPDQISQKDQELMQSITDEVGVAIENARLTHQLEEVDQKLSDANTHLKEMDSVKDEFISIASHQLRSPLTAIKGYLSMLRDGDYGQVSAEHRPILDQLAQSTNEVINLTNDMLSVSRINAERFELTLTAVRLEDVVTEVVNELRPLATQKSLGLSLSLPAESLGDLQLDQLRMRQVIVNFIDNAIKYTPRGRVRVILKRAGDEIIFKVTDSGIGIPESERRNLFTKFYRASNAKQAVVAGSGLGLFVAKRIVTEHGGELILESTEGKGSTFGFRIPVPALRSSEPARPHIEAGPKA